MKKIYLLWLVLMTSATLGGCRMIESISQAKIVFLPTQTATVVPVTRTPRPTFTLVLATLMPTITPESTRTPVKPTTTSTRRSLPTSTRTPTAKPVASPTARGYSYRFFSGTCPPEPDRDGPCRAPQGVVCHHSGVKEIRVVIYRDYLDAASGQPGARVVISNKADGAVIEPIEIAGGDGVAHKTLAGEQDSPSKNVGTYFAWVIDGSGVRISEMSPSIVLTEKTPNQGNFCSVAVVLFAGGF